MTPTPEPRDFDLDEDLFDFASVAREPEPPAELEDLDRVFASLRDSIAEEELLAGVPPSPRAAPAATVSMPVDEGADRLPPSLAPRHAHAPPARDDAARPEREEVHASTSASAAFVEPVPQVRAPEPAAALPVDPTGTPRARGPAFTRGLVAVALAVTVLNSAVAVTLLRGRDETAHGGAPAAEPAAHAAAPERGERVTHDAVLPDPSSVSPTTHPALEAARAEIARGEYAGARQRVYALLAIIDRLEEPRRSALEADCQYIVAQTLHLEALARMGGGR